MAGTPGLVKCLVWDLDLVMAIKRADEEDLFRVEELTLRTSQMNATGVHYPDEVLRGLLADPDHIAYRFAGFTEESCPCLAELESAPGREGILCLHLSATPRGASSTMRLTAPDLDVSRAPARPSSGH